MNTVITALVCLSPLLFVAFGFYIGRYGSPIVLKIQRPRNRRAVATPQEESEELDVFTAQSN